MKKISLIAVVSIFAAGFFCSISEAAPGASKVYKVSVTIPAICHTATNTSSRLQTEAQNMQVAMEQDVRSNETVVVKKVVAK